MTHPSPTLRELEERDARRLVDLLARRQMLTSIRDHAFPGRTMRIARKEVIGLAQSEAFGSALEEHMPPAIKRVAHDLWVAWRDQDERVRQRDRLRTLRRIVAELDSIAGTVRSLRPARHHDAQPTETSGGRR